MSGVYEMLTQFKSKLQVSRVPHHTFARILDQNLYPLLFRDLQFLRFFGVQLMTGVMSGKKFFMRCNLPIEAFHFQVRDFSN